MAVRVGSAFIDFQARNARFLAATKANAEAMRRQQRAVRSLQRNIRTFNREAALMARRLSFVAGAGVGLAVRAFTRFGETMARVRGVSGATADQFRELQQQALNLGRVTRFSATQAAEGQLFLARAGFEVGQVYAALPGTLRLAQAASIEVGQAADIVTNALSAFGEAADQTGRFVDVLAKTTTSANTDMVQLADALKLVAPVSRALGVSMETTSAAIGVLSDAGLQATLAGTGLRKVMFDLQSPTAKTGAILSDLGLTAADVSIQQNGLIDVLQRLADAGINATQVIEIFGARGAPAFLNLAAAIPRLRELERGLLDSAGAAANLQRIMDDTLDGAFRRLISAAEGFGIALTQTSGLGSGLQRGVDALASAINRMTDNLATNIDRITHAATLLFGVALARTRIARAATGIVTNFARAATSLVTFRTAALAAGRSFTRFYSFRPLTALRSSIETVRIRMLLMGDAARRAGTRIVQAVRAPRAAVAALSARVGGLRGSFGLVGKSARAGFAVAATAARTAARGVGLAFRGLSKAFAPLLIIEGIVQVASFLVELGKEAKRVGVSFKDAAIVAGVDFVQFIVRAFVQLLTIVPRLMHRLFVQLAEIAKSGGRALWAAVRAVFTGGNIADAFTGEFEGAFERAGEAGRLAFETTGAAVDQLNESLQFSDQLLHRFGVTADEVERAREAVSAAGRTTLDNFLGLFTGGFGGAGGAGEGATGDGSGPLPRISQPLVLPVTIDTTPIEAAGEEVKILVDGFADVGRAAGDAGRAVGDFARDMLLRVQSLGDAVKNLGRRLAEIAFQVGIGRRFEAGATEFFEGLFGQRQHGGPVEPGRAYVVGEAGPELFLPSRLGTVVSNGALRAAAAGGGETAVNYHFSPVIRTGDEAAVRRVLAEERENFRRFVDARIAAAGQPGRLRRAVHGR
ncbi:phage tail tape measure protein [Candidatus Palauibacter sp.]|uniref:phage tail tape measure protein n=1 Tax=Candidatus Palauibacter sp. TaxID=3101350 RepID=UPI003CC597EC